MSVVISCAVPARAQAFRASSRLALTLLICALLTACAASVMPGGRAAERELKALADAWDRALVAKDRAGIEANMAPDFTQMRAGGTVVNRAQFIADVMDPAFRMDPYRVEDFGVRVYGDTALVTGRIRMTGSDGGQTWNVHFRYIDVYVHRDGRWRVVSVQVTPMAIDE